MKKLMFNNTNLAPTCEFLFLYLYKKTPPSLTLFLSNYVCVCVCLYEHILFYVVDYMCISDFI